MNNKKSINYEGRDLEAMSFAINYHQWILDLFRPYVGKDIVEVGAGSGSVTLMLKQYKPNSLVAIEPSREMYPELKKNLVHTRNIYTYQDFFYNISDEIRRKFQPDTFFYVNVMEHIPDDSTEISTVYNTLKPGGRLLIFVPALPFLLSNFDKKIGHFRRYLRKDLERKCKNSGFDIELSRYFDFPGVIPWFIKYRFAGSTKMSSKQIDMYDKKIIPIIKPIETFIPPIIGKNIILVARKSQ